MIIEDIFRYMNFVKKTFESNENKNYEQAIFEGKYNHLYQVIISKRLQKDLTSWHF